MEEIQDPPFSVMGMTGLVVVTILFTWVLYREESHSRARGSYYASYGITSFGVIELGFLIGAFPEVSTSSSMVDQIVYWISVLFLSVYLIFLIQDMRKLLKVQNHVL